MEIAPGPALPPSTDSEEEAFPAQAARNTWRNSFGRDDEQPSDNDICVFIVLDRSTGRSIEIDLRDERHVHPFR
ncbi:hypothetical protein ACFRQM_40010 [Streptomyces sp. NPDC056831]|uniref:hypothetical protein n=1 Tax=Streptomyces sp. NPDC056831 TaxID=3345954 RepID=UPI0036C5B3D3